jgi:N-acetylmuramoyl-L-alanine amidase
MILQSKSLNYYIRRDNMKIFVRFGHDTLKSGSFTGATGVLTEKWVIDAYAPYLAEELYKSGHEVMTYSHTNGVYSTANEALNAGIAAAKNWGAELFVSCHANASDVNPNASYSMCYYKDDALSKKLATAVSQTACTTIGTSKSNGGTNGSGSFGECNASLPHSAIIIEPFFVTNATDCNKFQSVGGAAVGRAFARTIMENI